MTPAPQQVRLPAPLTPAWPFGGGGLGPWVPTSCPSRIPSPRSPSETAPSGGRTPKPQSQDAEAGGPEPKPGLGALVGACPETEEHRAGGGEGPPPACHTQPGAALHRGLSRKPRILLPAPAADCALPRHPQGAVSLLLACQADPQHRPRSAHSAPHTWSPQSTAAWRAGHPPTSTKGHRLVAECPGWTLHTLYLNCTAGREEWASQAPEALGPCLLLEP